MKKMNKELRTTFVFSTHDHDIMAIADPQYPSARRTGDRNIRRSESAVSTETS